jgi:acetyl-CoA carboxylase biotin carboxyl carrier protein
MPWAQSKKNRFFERRIIRMATPVTVPMVGKIVSVSVKVGDKVKEDDQVAVLEAMKMEMPVVAPASGTVKEIKVVAGQEVEAEAVIAVIE